MEVLFPLSVYSARLSWVALVILVAVFIGHSSIYGTTTDLSPYGGLQSCFKCNTGWNWHPLMMTLAFPVAMLESLLAFKSPILPFR